MDEKLVLDVMAEIRDYLAARPDSADTLEGIHQYWLLWPNGQEAPAVTQAALDLLLEAGVVECVRYGGRVLWRRRREKEHKDETAES
ncbi:MAG TPA: hypothetical protein VM571_15495 [Noviherbaspirillum sp.]|nr:hypothetical protein [Noviherbaspirillum sp.]